MHPLLNALIVVNPTTEFAPELPLSRIPHENAVPHGDLILAHVREFVREHEDEYVVMVATSANKYSYHPNIEISEFDLAIQQDDVGLFDYLKAHKIGHVDIVGLPLETAVKEMSVGCLKFGLDVSILTTMVAGYERVTSDQTVESLMALGIHVDGWGE